MFGRVFQPGLLCIFDADHENPLKLWEKKIRSGQIKRTISNEVKGLVLEITSKTPMTNYINCPPNIKQNLGISFPFFHMIVRLFFSTMFAFDIQIVDDKAIRRRLRASTIQTFVDIQPFMCKLPLAMEGGWNHISIPLHYFIKNIYGTNYVKTLRVTLYPNCLLKKIYFSDREYCVEDIPKEFNIEDVEAVDSYSVKYSSMVIQKRKNSLSYYPDLIAPKHNRAMSTFAPTTTTATLTSAASSVAKNCLEF